MSTPNAHTDFLAALSDAGPVDTDPDVLDTYKRDQAAPGFVAAGVPVALVRPATTPQVQAAVQAAAAHRIPIVPRGAGSGLSGGANAIDGCLIVCLERMTNLTVNADDLTATAQPGVINAHLDDAARAKGLWYPPDPASREWSTIGGNVATNAGGLCCVKYGVTRDAVRALEVVLADGRAIRVGHRTRKGVAGYDLAALMCGSEGTLGILTEVTVGLRPPPPPASTLAASFSTLVAAGIAITNIVRRHRPSLLELMDRTTVRAVEEFHPQDLDRDAAALLFARSDAGHVEGRDEVAAMERICVDAGADLVVTSDEEAEGRMLMAARRLAYPALERRGATLLDDVAVPISRIPVFLEQVEHISRRHGVLIGTFGHAGDGNMHPTVVYDQTDPEEAARARAAFGDIVTHALELGGTCTGEHGVGLLKRDWLREDLGDALEVNRLIKSALDPNQLLNPGKAL